jgi:DNA-binding CsgD family transcriptional regulator
MGFGGLLLGTAGEVLALNRCARVLLSKVAVARPSDDELVLSREALKLLLRSETSTRFTMNEDAWVVIPRPDDDSRPLVMHAVPIDNAGSSGPHTALVLVDLDTAPRPTPEALQKIFGLTLAEAKLAIEVARGKSLEDIAAETRISVSTARKQLASIFSKTNTHRQGELVALLARVSILP